MSLIETTLLTAWRAFVIALLAVLPGLFLTPFLRQLSRRAIAATYVVGTLVYFTPTMLAGYGWLPSVAQSPVGSFHREVFYGVALIVRFAPLAAIALWLGNAGPSAAAQHTWRAAGGRGVSWWLREAGATPWLAMALVFLLAFQEFDLATSWGIRAWTVALFDAQIGGLALRESLRLALLPLLVEAVVIAPLLFVVARSSRPAAPPMETDARRASAAAIAYIVPGFLILVVLPANFVLRLGRDGFSAWLESMTLHREVAHGLISALLASGLAWAISGVVRGRWAAVLAAPGLLGSLLLSLIALAALQMVPPVAMTVFPWLGALILQLLPAAFLLRAIIRRGTDAAAVHTARLAAARPAEWTLVRRPAAGALVLLFGIAYSDFTISALLAPPQFTTVFVRVFNLMHYGQSAVLSATLFVAIVVPLAALALTYLVIRVYFARRVR